MRLNGEYSPDKKCFKFRIPIEGDIESVVVRGFIDANSKSVISHAVLRYSGMPLDTKYTFQGPYNELKFCDGAKLHTTLIANHLDVDLYLTEEAEGYLDIDFISPPLIDPARDPLVYEFKPERPLRTGEKNKLFYTGVNGGRYLMMYLQHIGG